MVHWVTEKSVWSCTSGTCQKSTLQVAGKISFLGGVQLGSHSTTTSPKAGAGEAAGTGCYWLLYSEEVGVRGATHTAGAGHRGNGVLQEPRTWKAMCASRARPWRHHHAAGGGCWRSSTHCRNLLRKFQNQEANPLQCLYSIPCWKNLLPVVWENLFI